MYCFDSATQKALKRAFLTYRKITEKPSAKGYIAYLNMNAMSPYFRNALAKFYYELLNNKDV